MEMVLWIAGIPVVVLSIIVVACSAFFVHKKRGGLVLIPPWMQALPGEQRVWRAIRFLIAAGLLAGMVAGCGITDSAKYGNRQVRGTVLPVSANRDIRTPDLLITNWAPSQDVDTFYLTYVTRDGEKWDVRWERELEEFDRWYHPMAVFDTERAYYVAEASLLALNRADGTTDWETPLSDLVTASCQHCLQIVADRVVVLTTDYVLQGIDAAGGELLWSVRLNDAATARDGFSLVDEQVVLLDWIAPDSHKTAIHVFDPKDGKLVRQVAPACPNPDDQPDIEEAVIAPPTLAFGGHAIILNDCGFDPYVQSWDLTAGRMLWRQALPEEADSGVNSILSGEERVYLDTYYGLFAISMADGQTELLAEEIDPDYSWQLLDEHQGILLAWARRTRGSSRYELWALDASGERIWRHEMQGDSLLEVSSGIADCAYRFAPDDLLLIQTLDDPDQLLLEVLDPRTGQVLDQSAREVERASLDDVAWSGYYGYLTTDGDVYEIDLEMMALTAAWP